MLQSAPPWISWGVGRAVAIAFVPSPIAPAFYLEPGAPSVPFGRASRSARPRFAVGSAPAQYALPRELFVAAVARAIFEGARMGHGVAARARGSNDAVRITAHSN